LLHQVTSAATLYHFLVPASSRPPTALSSTASPWSTNHFPEPRPAPTCLTQLQSPVEAHSMRASKHSPVDVPQYPSNRRWDLGATTRPVLAGGARVHRICWRWLELRHVPRGGHASIYRSPRFLSDSNGVDLAVCAEQPPVAAFRSQELRSNPLVWLVANGDTAISETPQLRRCT
jgi:hypothetical protein